MRFISAFLITLAVQMGPSAIYAQDANMARQQSYERGAMKDCEANQTNLNLCSYHRYKALDEELNQLFKKLHLRASITADQKRLVNSERAWLKYVEQDCLFRNGLREESGTIWPLQQNTCLSDHYVQRIKILKSYLDCNMDGCPGN